MGKLCSPAYLTQLNYCQRRTANAAQPTPRQRHAAANPPFAICRALAILAIAPHIAPPKSSLRNCSGHYRAPSNCPTFILPARLPRYAPPSLFPPISSLRIVRTAHIPPPKSSLRNCSGHYRAPSNCPTLIHASDCAHGAHSSSQNPPFAIAQGTIVPQAIAPP